MIFFQNRNHFRLVSQTIWINKDLKYKPNKNEDEVFFMDESSVNTCLMKSLGNRLPSFNHSNRITLQIWMPFITSAQTFLWHLYIFLWHLCTYKHARTNMHVHLRTVYTATSIHLHTNIDIYIYTYTPTVLQRRPQTHLYQKGPAGSYWARSSLAPPPWHTCHPGWRGSWSRSQPLSSDQTCSGTYWASPHLSVSPARLWT